MLMRRREAAPCANVYNGCIAMARSAVAVRCLEFAHSHLITLVCRGARSVILMRGKADIAHAITPTAEQLSKCKEVYNTRVTACVFTHILAIYLYISDSNSAFSCRANYCHILRVAS